jgi:hypothetical protein
MKNIAVAFFLLLPISVAAAQTGAWLEAAPSSMGGFGKWVKISDRAFFEVPASKLDAAETSLSNVTFLAQSSGDPAYFGRPDFQCTAPSKPYLVRALYINGGTGSFSLYWADSSLVVAQGSLGSPDAPTPNKSVLVACLSKEPKAVYSVLSSAL